MTSDKSSSENSDSHKSGSKLIPPRHDEGRASFLSNISYEASEIGKAVPVAMINNLRNTGEVKQMYVENVNTERPIGEDDESVFSGSVKLGRLDTVKSVDAKGLAQQPELTVTTAVESVIPPRLRRRPISELPTTAEVIPKSPKSAKRGSLTINEDLDKLMESANILKENTSASKMSVNESMGSGLTNRVVTETNLSSDAFETAEGDSVSSSQETTNFSAPLKLPKRPNAANLGKARQASLEFASKQVPGDRKDHLEILSIETASSFHTDDQLIPESQGGETDAGIKPKTDDVSKSLAKKLIPQRLYSEESKISPRTGNNEYNNPDKDFDKVHAKSIAIDNFPTEGIQTDPATHLVQADEGRTTVPQENFADMNQNTTNAVLPPPIETSSLEQPDKLRNVDPDNEFYDIEEPILVSQPSQGKPIKDSMKNGSRRSKKGARKSRRSTDSKLKPFSYSTLVNLLESINGTVIGEEFESLNLPTQEKQLIEKIIDLLSRLTSDMVLDENRYLVGIARLEKAHRVLEGFM